MVRLLLLSLLFLQGALALSTFAQESRKRSSAVAYVDPNVGGGSVIDISSSGLKEPLNVIISGLSSPGVLTDDGFTQFVKAIGFEPVTGTPQEANLGDGHGLVNQALELRQQELALISMGSEESESGFNYLRLFRQNGPKANTGALFLGVSFLEDGASEDSSGGYDIGRDNFVKGATSVTSYQGVKYQTVAKSLTGLIQPGTLLGVNQGSTTDGVVALLTVTIVP